MRDALAITIIGVAGAIVGLLACYFVSAAATPSHMTFGLWFSWKFWTWLPWAILGALLAIGLVWALRR